MNSSFGGRLARLGSSALLALLGATAATAAVGPRQVNDQSSVRLVSPLAVAPAAAAELELGLHFTTAPGWHVYWKNSGDAGFPPTVKLTSTDGRVAGGEILWPAPNRFELPGGLMAFGFEGEVVYPLRVPVRAGGAASPLALSADVDYLVCEVDCVPYRYTLKLSQPLGDAAQADPETAALFDRWRALLPTPLERAAGVSARGELVSRSANEAALTLHLAGVDAKAAAADLFFASDDAWEASRPKISAEGDGLSFTTEIRARDARKGLPSPLTVAWTATGLTRQGRGLAVEASQSLSPAAPGAAAEPAAGAAPGSRLGGPVLGFLVALLALGAAWLLLAPASGKMRTGLGFLLLALAVAPLYALSRRVSAEGLATVELALLGIGLFAWLRARSRRRPAALWAATAAMLLSALAIPWLVQRGRLERPADRETQTLTDVTPGPASPATTPRT